MYIQHTNISLIHESVFLIIHESVFLIIQDTMCNENIYL